MDKIKEYDYNKFSIIELFPKYRELKVEYEKIEKAFNVEKKEKARYKNLCKTKNAEILDKDIEIERLNNIINELEKKLQELKGSNEPSFEEMVGFVENVYKDIKSQSTLHEELEEERKTIAKIVGDFKEINK